MNEKVLNKYKLCPVCGEKNPPTEFECLKCGADLMRVPVTDDAAVKKTEEQIGAVQAGDIDKTETGSGYGNTHLVKICSSGHVNPVNARKCSVCGEDLSDVVPVSESSPHTKAFFLKSLDGQAILQIGTNDVTVGRDREMGGLLREKKYVSRIHAKFSVENGELYIENLSHTNYTFVNNVKIQGKTELKRGDEIGLGGNSVNGERQPLAAYFMVDTER